MNRVLKASEIIRHLTLLPLNNVAKIYTKFKIMVPMSLFVNYVPTSVWVALFTTYFLV